MNKNPVQKKSSFRRVEKQVGKPSVIKLTEYDKNGKAKKQILIKNPIS